MMERCTAVGCSELAWFSIKARFMDGSGFDGFECKRHAAMRLQRMRLGELVSLEIKGLTETLVSRRRSGMEKIHFTCPGCGADLSDQAWASAHDWSEGIPTSAGAWCDNCQADRFFELEWGEPFLMRADAIREEGGS